MDALSSRNALALSGGVSQDRDRVAQIIGDGNLRLAIAIQISDGDPFRIIANSKIYFGSQGNEAQISLDFLR